MRAGADNRDLRVRAADDPESLLVIVADVDPCSWVRSTGSSTKGAELLRHSIQSLIAFIRAFELLHDGNRAIVLTVSSTGHRLAYPTCENGTIPDSAIRAEEDESGRVDDLDEAIPAAVRECLAGVSGNSASVVSSALARALCIVNRAQINGTKIQPRILTMLAGSDDPAQYVSAMNCFFSAQRMKVPIDACVVSHSTYFQQAAYLTKGVYMKPDGFPDNADSLLQTLLTVFLVDPLSRDFLAMPVPGEVDFRASCFDTRKVIDSGFTCSVCLSTFDMSVKKKSPICRVCGARFAVIKPVVARKRAAK